MNQIYRSNTCVYRTFLLFISLAVFTHSAIGERDEGALISEERIKLLEQRIGQLESTADKPKVQTREHRKTNGVPVNFDNTTESRSGTSFLDDKEVADRVERVLNNYVDISGYFRAGYGRNSEGGVQPGFKAPGAMAKYRLGNEAENFGEVIIGKNFYTPDNFTVGQNGSTVSASGPVAHVQLRIDFFNPHDEFSNASNTDVGFPEAWASLGNVLKSMPTVKFWAGNRFYRRHDIGVNDFFFWNMSGGGAGIEDITLGGGKLAVAWIGSGATSGFSNLPQPNPEDKAGFSKTNLDIRFYDLPVFKGNAEIGLILSRAKTGLDAEGNSGPESTGYSLHFVHSKSQFISHDGVNKFSVQYGTKAAKTFSSGFETFQLDGGTYIQPDNDDSWRFRVTENFSANIDDHFSLGPVLIYQVTDYGENAGKQTWISAGVRPIYHFDDRISLAFEAGWDHVDSEVFDTIDHLYKITIAPQISLGGRFNSRPVIRAYATYAGWGDDFVGQVGGNDYLGKNNGASFGVQMEAWW